MSRKWPRRKAGNSERAGFSPFQREYKLERNAKSFNLLNSLKV